MSYLEKIVTWVGEKGMLISGVFIIGWIGLIMGNVFLRPFGGVIYGNYEIVEIVALGVAAFALAYAGLKHHHVAIKLVTERFPQRLQARIAIFTLFIEIVFWGLVFWMSADLLKDWWLSERTEQLRVPVLPFRIVWVFGLFLFCLILIVDFYKRIREEWK